MSCDILADLLSTLLGPTTASDSADAYHYSALNWSRRGTPAYRIIFDAPDPYICATQNRLPDEQY
jgi:hypothetical protein